MTSKNPIKLNCPTCNNPVVWSDQFPFRPFCCKRCQLIDFGGWATEQHAIPGKEVFTTQAPHDEANE